MKLRDKVVVVTGGGQGIGEALAQRFHSEGARAVVIADLDLEKADQVARSIEGRAFRCDVAKEDDLRRVIERTEADIGPIDLFCSNAGFLDRSFPPADAAAAPDAIWNRAWSVHVMAHVHAARALLPRMIARGGGYFLNTVSAAGLLSQIGNAVYSTTKHAAIGFAESLAITHRDQGIKVSVLCPQGVDTPLLPPGARGAESLDGVLSPEECAEAAIRGLAAETFLILPHPQVADYFRRKAEDYDRWLGGMAKLRRKLEAQGGGVSS